MKRYIVFEVGCLECNSGESDPAVILRTDDLDEARKSMTEMWASGMADRFTFDTVSGDVIKAAQDY
jgi:hypothetical protein